VSTSLPPPIAPRSPRSCARDASSSGNVSATSAFSRPSAASAATAYEQAAVADDRQRRAADVAADEIEDDVDLADRAGNVGRGVVDELVGAEAQQLLVVDRARRPDDVRAARERDLDREVPDAARRGLDEHPPPPPIPAVSTSAW
jgi:hypothetical protein